jgi:HTH-type transcriptional regulator/antitoxin HigA
MLHNEVEYRNAKKRLDDLQSEIDKRSLAVEREAHQQTTPAVIESLRMKIGDVERELEASDLDEFGELVIKARIAKGWSQTDLAEALETHPQQVQRYERNDWQKISLWRLQEIVEVLDLHLKISAYIDRREGDWPGSLWSGDVTLWSADVSYEPVEPSWQSGTERTLERATFGHERKERIQTPEGKRMKNSVNQTPEQESNKQVLTSA